MKRVGRNLGCEASLSGLSDRFVQEVCGRARLISTASRTKHIACLTYAHVNADRVSTHFKRLGASGAVGEAHWNRVVLPLYPWLASWLDDANRSDPWSPV